MRKRYGNVSPISEYPCLGSLSSCEQLYSKIWCPFKRTASHELFVVKVTNELWLRTSVVKNFAAVLVFYFVKQNGTCCSLPRATEMLPLLLWIEQSLSFHNRVYLNFFTVRIPTKINLRGSDRHALLGPCGVPLQLENSNMNCSLFEGSAETVRWCYVLDL